MKRKVHKMKMFEVHSELFDVLCEVDRILNKYEIKYYLIFGTLLGCMRGGEPIKWDDDIDICVNEADWSCMNNALKEELNTERFFLLNKDSKKNYPDWRFITRVGVKGTYRRMDYYVEEDNKSGIFIDIFQLVNVPETTFKCKIWQYEMGCIDGVINMLSLKKGTYPRPYIISKLLYLLSKNKSVYEWNCIRYDLQTKYCGANSIYVTVPFGPFGVYNLKKAKYKRKWFAKNKRYTFAVRGENGLVIRSGKFPVPIGYAQILKTTYGNWKSKPVGRYLPQFSFWRE